MVNEKHLPLIAQVVIPALGLPTCDDIHHLLSTYYVLSFNATSVIIQPNR